MTFQSLIKTTLAIYLLCDMTFSKAIAQPIGTTNITLEARIAKADVVVIATIDSVAHEVLPNRIDAIPLGGHLKYTVTLKFVEVLKGDRIGLIDDLRPKYRQRVDDRYSEWSKAGTTLLCFLGPTPKKGESRDWDFIAVGRTVPAEERQADERKINRLFSHDLTLLKDEIDLLARSRAYAKLWPKVQSTHAIEIPALMNPGSSGGPDYVVVPVEPTLEKRAKRLIATPAQFLPAKFQNEVGSQEMLRLGGVNALRYFKSNDYSVALQAILANDKESFTMRSKALAVLLQWDIEFVLPESAQAITELDLSRSQITDAGMKRLAGLRELSTLKLEDTKITAAGLKELSALNRLRSLWINGSQFTDAYLQALCQIGKMHTLEFQTGGQPRVADDIYTLAFPGSSITDAGLIELAKFRNLISLDLSQSKVTDAGLMELAGLKKLTELVVQGTKVTENGAAELQNALPNCKVVLIEKQR